VLRDSESLIAPRWDPADEIHLLTKCATGGYGRGDWREAPLSSIERSSSACAPTGST